LEIDAQVGGGSGWDAETSAYYKLTPEKDPKENIQYSNHGESLKSTKFRDFTFSAAHFFLYKCVM